MLKGMYRHKHQPAITKKQCLDESVRESKGFAAGD